MGFQLVTQHIIFFYYVKYTCFEYKLSNHLCDMFSWMEVSYCCLFLPAVSREDLVLRQLYSSISDFQVTVRHFPSPIPRRLDSPLVGSDKLHIN